MKKIIGIFTTLCLCLFFAVGCSCSKDNLPKAEVGEGYLGSEFGVDKNVNVNTIDNYLNRSDAVYRDMRMLVDPAEYENIGGDRYLSGFIKGFEVVPYPYLVNTTGLPEAVGNTYQGETLFTLNEQGQYVANYQESMDIIEYLFPKDKKIFLMCGGGGYAGMTRTFLLALGYDKDNIYNVGGFWSYEGNNAVSTKLANGHYDFSKVAYHAIDFSVLTSVEA